MKAVVFGGSGFLGSHVADVLSADGMDVTIYDTHKSGFLRNDQTMVIGDITDYDKVMSVLDNCDYVYNFAGVANIEQAEEEPRKTIEVNVLGNTNLLEACRNSNVKRFIFASTLYVYSSMGSFYRASKQACELTIEAYAERFGIDYTILRYGSLYGLRTDDKNWIYKIICQAIEEKKITRNGDGKELREYIHVLDAARLSVSVLSPKYRNQYVIIAGQHTMTVENLMIMIKEMLNNEIDLEFVSGDKDSHYEITPYNFKPKLAERIVGSSYVDLGQGILELLNHIYDQKKAEREKLVHK